MINKIDLSGGNIDNTNIYTAKNGVIVNVYSVFNSTGNYYPAYMFNNSFGGSPTDYWLGASASSQGDIIIDFSKYGNGSIDLEGLKIFPYCRSDSYADYSISMSTNNGTTYEEVVPLVGNTNNNSALGVSKDYPIVKNDVTHIKLTLKSYGAWGACLNEIEVYGKQSNKKMLLKSNNKIYSLGQNEMKYTENLIPVMTSNTSPSGIANASSEYTSWGCYAWRGFDASITTSWFTLNTKSGWLSYEFTEPKIIGKYTIYGYNTVSGYEAGNPKDWTFEAWDGFKWIVLDTQSNVLTSSWVSNIEKSYEINNTIAYKKYRLNVSNNNGHETLRITELRMFGLIIPKLTNLPVLSVDNFINYGQSSFTSLNTTLSNKTYILQEGVNENVDGLWVQEIDRKPLSIKFEVSS